LLAAVWVACAGCVAEPESSPPPWWWDGPGADLAPPAPDDALGDGSPPTFRPHAIVAVDAGPEVDLVQVEHWRASAETTPFWSGPAGARLVGSGSVLAVLARGPASSLTVGPFASDWDPFTADLPPDSDPAAFVQGTSCSLVALEGTRTALIVGDQQPVFVPLEEHADDDGDPEVASAVRLEERLLVGLQRTSPDGPGDGGRVVEIDCEGQVLGVRPLGPGARLVGPGRPGHVVYVREWAAAGEVLHRFDPVGASGSGARVLDPPAEGGVLGPVAVIDSGQVWAVVEDGDEASLWCYDPFAEEGAEILTFDAPVVDLEVDWMGHLLVLVGGDDPELRIHETEGCVLSDDEPRRWEVSEDASDLAAVVRVVTQAE